MGLVTESENITYLRIATKKGSDMGLYAKNKGDDNPVFHKALVGRIVAIDKKVEIPKAGQTWKAYVNYRFTFEDENNDKYILQLNKSVKITDWFINLLAGVENPGVIKFGVFAGDEGYPVAWMHNDGGKVTVKKNWKEDVPKIKVIKTGRFAKVVTAEGETTKEKIEYDRTEREDFFESLLIEITPIITGQVWSAGTNVIANDASHPSNQQSKKASNVDVFMANIEKHYNTSELFLENFSKIAEGVKARFKNHQDQMDITVKLEDYISRLNVKETKYRVNIEVGICAREALPPVDFADDLPF